jgi:RNA polymerase sigma-70 factor (ECF subfamily)
MADAFPTTQWSIVLAARGDRETGRAALETLCATYWYPIYGYIRGRGHDADTARDLTQGFFVDLLDRDFLEPVDPAKGRFRAFLLASLKNFLSHQRERAQAQKRGAGVSTISLDAVDAEQRFGREPVDHLTPDQIFERRWGLTVMERAMRRLEMVSASRPRQFQRLRAFLTGSEPDTTYRQVAAELGLTEGAVKTAVHRMRQDYGQILRDEIAATIANPSDLDDELRHLLKVVRPWQEPSP